MKRRRFLEAAGSTSLLSLFGARPTASSAATTLRRANWDLARPSPALWDELNASVGGQLIKAPPLLAACAGAPTSATCDDVLRNLRNPYYLGDQPAGTQMSGWVDAWRSRPARTRSRPRRPPMSPPP